MQSTDFVGDLLDFFEDVAYQDGAVHSCGFLANSPSTCPPGGQEHFMINSGRSTGNTAK